jgi:hypothetical protein
MSAEPHDPLWIMRETKHRSITKDQEETTDAHQGQRIKI